MLSTTQSSTVACSVVMRSEIMYMQVVVIIAQEKNHVIKLISQALRQQLNL